MDWIYTPIWMAQIHNTDNTSTDEDVEQQELSYIVSENIKGQESPRHPWRKTKLEDFLDWVSSLRMLQK